MSENYYIRTEDSAWAARQTLAVPPVPGDVIWVEGFVATVLRREFTGNGMLPTIIVSVEGEVG